MRGIHPIGTYSFTFRPATIENPTAKDLAAGTAREMILVSPDAFSVHNGSFYSNSRTTGDWETFLAVELVNYIDSHYRMNLNRMSRGLVGHSMGGYGTFRIGMKHPEVFSSLFSMSACCMLDPGEVTPAMTQLESIKTKTPRRFHPRRNPRWRARRRGRPIRAIRRCFSNSP